jgi:hypothetical protein
MPPCKNPTSVIYKNPTQLNNNKCLFKQIDATFAWPPGFLAAGLFGHVIQQARPGDFLGRHDAR